MFKKLINSLIIITTVSIFFLSCNAVVPAQDIKVNPLFTDNMVLQQKQDITIWGTAKPEGDVTVIFNDQNKKTSVDENGNWEVVLKPVPAGGPYKLEIKGKETLEINNVMVGEVWICSGQSNMEMPIFSGWSEINDAKQEIASANYPDLRIIMVEKNSSNQPIDNFKSSGWKVSSPESIPNFSAVAYFFGRKLQKELNVPIGLIQTAWGGTVVEAWTSGESLKNNKDFKEAVEIIALDETSEEAKKLIAQKRKEGWPGEIEKILKNSGSFDQGFQNFDNNTKNWKTMKLPTIWEKTGMKVDGIVWFSKNIQIPDSWQGGDLTLHLGKINDFDNTWFNGVRVGQGIDVTDLRVYNIPKKLVKKGNNKIVVQVLDIGNNGGLYGPEDQMKILAKNDSLSLIGDWKYKIDPIKLDLNKIPEKPNNNSGVNRPTVLYNAMINPLLNYSIKGAIWYQGESNAGRAYQYRGLFKTLIKDWRSKWNQGDFPFYFVQLANFMEVKPNPEDDAWAELREAQTMALELPNTGMAVAIDIGDATDIHPTNKQDVGNRLALNALAKDYKKDITFSGPVYKAMQINGDAIEIEFDHVDKGLKTRDNKKLVGFEIAGADKLFVWADAKIVDNKVVVSSKKIKKPVAVRYAWAANPVCNLYNNADLPASPFRTDKWPGITINKK